MTAAAGFLLDANRPVLFVVGVVDTGIIGKHWRLAGYTAADYENWRGVFRRNDRILATPNTPTEASNLLRQHGEPERSRLMAGLQYLIEHSEEVAIPSARVAANPSFVDLGLTDAVLMEVVSPQTPLITVEMGLYQATLERSENAAVNFREFMTGSL